MLLKDGLLKFNNLEFNQTLVKKYFLGTITMDKPFDYYYPPNL
jgi:hypothetical protein